MSERVDLSEQARTDKSARDNTAGRARALAEYSALAERCGAAVEPGNQETVVGIGIGVPIFAACLDAPP